RDAFLCANSGGRVPYDGPAEESARLTELAERIGNVALVRGLEVMGQAIVDIRGQAVADPRLVLEVAVIRLARRESRTREETLLDRVIEVWPAALESLKAPLRAAIQDAQPIGIEDGVIVFGAPPGKRFETINARFRSEAAAIKAALEPHLGSQPRFRLLAHDFEALDALRPVSV